MLFKQTFTLTAILFALCSVLQLTSASQTEPEFERVFYPMTQEFLDNGYYMDRGVKKWYIPQYDVSVSESNFVHHGYDDNYYAETGVKRWWVSHDPETFTYQEPQTEAVIYIPKRA